MMLMGTILCIAGFVAATGCFSERIPQTEVIVYKTDSEGTPEWVTNLNNGMQDFASTIIESSGGGYVIACGISDNPEGFLSPRVFPRVVKLDTSGTIVWDTVMNSTAGRFNFTEAGRAVFLEESQDGSITVWTKKDYIVTLSPDGTVDRVRTGASETTVEFPEANRNGTTAAPVPPQKTEGHLSLYVINAHRGPDGKMKNVSEDGTIHIVKQSESGSILWDRALTSTGIYNQPVTVIPVRDGGYIAVVSSAAHDKIPTISTAHTPVVNRAS